MGFDCKGEPFTLKFQVVRRRPSVTQGEAAVYCNGVLVDSFADEPEMMKEGKTYYPPFFGGYASPTPDKDFIYAALWHPFDDIYRISQPIRKIVNKRKAKEHAAELDADQAARREEAYRRENERMARQIKALKKEGK